MGHLIKGLGRGGAEMLLPPLVRASSAVQMTHVAYFLPWKDALVGELESCGASVTCLQASSTVRTLLSVGAARRWMCARRLDLVHCHLPVSGAVGRLAARAISLPVVYTEHNVQERYRRGTRWLNRTTWSLQDQAIAVSDEVARSIAENLPRSVPVAVVPNGIPARPFRAPDDRPTASRRSLGLGEGPLVGIVAVFRVQKRLDLWVAVARQIREEVPDARFVIVGDGPTRARLQRDIEAAGMAGSVLLPGLQENVDEWLAGMDVFMMTSEFEGLPLALLEAMMVGTPVVATAVGGIPEVIRDAENGFLVPFGSIEEQARRVVELLRDPRRRASVARAARRTVEERFGVDRMAARLDEIYRGILTGHRDREA